jgi:hypothetical protein
MSLPNLPTGISLPGSFIDAATKAANAAKAAAAAAVPSFDALMSAAKSSVSATADAISSGASGLFKDASSAISSVGAAQFGIGSESPNTAAFDAYKKQIADVQKNAMIDMAVAKAALAQKVKEASAAGVPISANAITSALDATKSLQNLQANMSNPAALAADALASAAAKAQAIESLKANTMLAMLSKPMPAALAGAVGSSMNPALVNNLTKLNIIKAQESSATQSVPGQSTPSDSVRPKDGEIVKNVSPPAPSITPPPVDNRVYAAEVVSYGDKKDASKTAYLAYIGVTWKKGDPNVEKAVQTAGLESKLDEVYDSVIGRSGANQERKDANAIAKAKPKDSNSRTAEEQALIDKVLVDKKVFYETPWWKKKGELFDSYSSYYDNYKLAYDCWINNGNRFSLPAAVEKELKSG